MKKKMITKNKIIYQTIIFKSVVTFRGVRNWVGRWMILVFLSLMCYSWFGNTGKGKVWQIIGDVKKMLK